MRIRTFAALLALPWLIAACGTTPVTLGYQPSVTAVATSAKPLIGVAAFVDRRGTDPHWLGAIRGGMGQPLKTLELQDTASNMVKEAYRQALATRGLLLADSSTRYTLGGTIIHLDCSQFVRREAHADIILTVTDNATGKPVMEQLFQKKIVEGSVLAMDTGMFASVDDLKAVAAQALNQVIDESLDSEAFRDAMRKVANAG